MAQEFQQWKIVQCSFEFQNVAVVPLEYDGTPVETVITLRLVANYMEVLPKRLYIA